MRIIKGLCLLSLVLSAGCSEQRDVRFELPEWAYDKPFYYLPAEAIPSINRFPLDKPLELYSNRLLIEIPRPEVVSSAKAPRVAIWLTDDGGINWQKIGYFGLYQRYFPYIVERDGSYGIRFVGPGIPPARSTPPRPHMIYNVDTTAPVVVVYVEPARESYTAGQKIKLSWTVSDINYKPSSTRIYIAIDSDRPRIKWDCINKDFSEDGSINIVIPDQAIDKVMLVKVIAQDKAGNIGIGYSSRIPVVYEPPEIEAGPSKYGSAAEESEGKGKGKKGEGTRGMDSGDSSGLSGEDKLPKVIYTQEGPQVLSPSPSEEYPQLEE